MKQCNALSLILSSTTRSEIFRVLFDGDDHEYYLRELTRQTSAGLTPLKSELAKLVKLDLLIQRRDGNRVYFKANVLHPLYIDLKSIVEKTVGMIALLKDVLNDKNIEIAFIFGSVAQNQEKAHSDIDLFIVGEITMRTLSKLLGHVQEKTGREINPHVYTRSELKKRLKDKDHFILSVWKAAKKEIRGSFGEVERLS